MLGFMTSLPKKKGRRSLRDDGSERDRFSLSPAYVRLSLHILMGITKTIVTLMGPTKHAEVELIVVSIASSFISWAAPRPSHWCLTTCLATGVSRLALQLVSHEAGGFL